MSMEEWQGKREVLQFRPPTLLRASFAQAGGKEAPTQAHPPPLAPTRVLPNAVLCSTTRSERDPPRSTDVVGARGGWLGVDGASRLPCNGMARFGVDGNITSMATVGAIPCGCPAAGRKVVRAINRTR
ncbi:MAG TPA: hypothetical protein VKY19_15950 [Ktedonosporobacter sp.]|nr:hypothetical protein [Ktedonosporobacter sp.]